MSFKFFRKHQKTMLWGVVILTVLTFSLFSVQSTMKACLQQESTDMGEFVLQDGTKVTLDRSRFNEVSRFIPAMFLIFRPGEKSSIDDIVDHVILYEDATNAGLTITDEELKSTFTRRLGQIPDSDTYKAWVRNVLGFSSPSKFEEALREYILVEKLKGYFVAGDDLILTADAYAKYAEENQQYKVEYLTFRAEDHAAEISAETVAEEDLEYYYDALDSYSPSIHDRYTIPEEFTFDIAYLDLPNLDLDAYTDKIVDIEVEDREVRVHYTMVKERFLIEEEKEPGDGEEQPGDEEAAPESGSDPEGEPEAETDPEAGTDDEAKPEDEAATDTEDKTEPEPIPQYKSIEEVRDLLEKELKIIKLLEKAQEEWNTFAKENDLIEKPRKIQPDDPSEGDESGDAEGDETEGEKAEGEEGEGNEAEEPVDPDAFFKGLCEKYGFSFHSIDEMVGLDGLETLDRFGSEGLKRRAAIQSQRKNSCILMRPSQDHSGIAFLARITDKVERQKKPIEDVHDELMSEYVDKKRMLLVREKIDAFRETLEERTKEFDDVRQEVETLTLEGEKNAEEKIANSETDLTEDQIENIRSAEQRGAEWRVKRFLNTQIGRVFGTLSAEQGLTIVASDYFTQSIATDLDALEKKDPAEKHIIKDRKLFNCRKGEVTHPLEDQVNKAIYLVHIADLRDPPTEEITLKELEAQRMQLKSDKFMQLIQAVTGRGPGRGAPRSMIPPIGDEGGGQPGEAILSTKNIIDKYKFRFYEVESSDEE